MARFKRILHSILVAIAVGATLPVNLTAAIGDNLAAYWKLDETSGSAAADASGNGNNGSIVGNPIWEAGRINGGLSFNGNDSLDAGSGPSLDDLDNQGLGGMTVAFWIRPTSQVSADIIRKSWWGAWTIALVATNNTLGLTFYKHFSSTALNVAFQNQLALNQWRHVAFTWNGQAPISAVALYVDGALKAYSSGNAGSGTKVSDANEDLLISSPRFGGSLDEVRLYNRVLTAAEISQLYNYNGSSPPPPPADTNAPVRSNGAPTGTLAAGTTAATLSLTTDEAAVCKCDTRANIPYASMTTTFATTGGTSHSQTVSGLTDGNAYTFYVRCRDAANNANANDYPISFGIASPAPSWTYSETAWVTGLQQPTAMEFSPDGRLFVLEQSGRIRVVKNGVLLAASFASLTVNATGERGLLGLAFDPNFANNGYLYIYYTAPTPQIHNRISRLKASLSNPDISDGTQVILFDALPPLAAAQHNGGAMHFGADGKLYVAVGENGIGYSSQSITNLLGKMLRLNPDGTIPSDNPSSFAGIGGSPTGWNRAIWAVGLRNPFTFAIDPLTGRMHINDVGSSDQIA